MINEEIKYNPFGPCTWHCDHFSAIKLAKVDWDTPYMHLHRTLQTMCFRLLK